MVELRMEQICSTTSAAQLHRMLQIFDDAYPYDTFSNNSFCTETTVPVIFVTMSMSISSISYHYRDMMKTQTQTNIWQLIWKERLCQLLFVWFDDIYGSISKRTNCFPLCEWGIRSSRHAKHTIVTRNSILQQ